MGMDIHEFQNFLSGSLHKKEEFEYALQKNFGHFDISGGWPEIGSMWHIRTGGSKINPNTFVTVCGIVRGMTFTTITTVTSLGISSGDFVNQDEWHSVFFKADFSNEE